jgi:hypothetical protein
MPASTTTTTTTTKASGTEASKAADAKPLDPESFASAQHEIAEAAQNQFIAAVKSQQRIALDAAKVWAEQVGKVYPKAPAAWASQLHEQAEKSNAIFEELLEAHRTFTSDLLDVLAPRTES